MRKVIAAINVTLDGVFDHTAVTPGEDIHQHYADLLEDSGVILYGRITYGLMEYWRDVVANPTGEKAMDDFAVVMDRVPKVVFSNTLKDTDWETARLATQSLEEEVIALKEQSGKDILVGSRSLIMSLLKQGLIDEFQLCIHPVIAGDGLTLFHDVDSRIELKLVRQKAFEGGAVILYYEPVR